MGTFDMSSSDWYNPTSINTLTSGSMGKIATLQTPPVLPDWLKTDPDSIMTELKDQYGQAGQYYNSTGIKRAYNKNISTTMGMGGQLADNAAREALSREGTEGGGTNAEFIKAQAMLPAYAQANDMRVEKQKALAGLKEKEGEMKIGIAEHLGQMRAGYLSMLAQTYQQGQGQNNAWVLAQQQMEAERQRMTGGIPPAAANASSAAANFNPGYLPNAGPIHPLSRNGVVQPNTYAAAY